MQRRVQTNPNAKSASMNRVRSSLRMSTFADGELRRELPRRRSGDIPVRTKSGTSMETLVRRQRQRNSSKARRVDKKERNESQDSQWNSSSGSEGEESDEQVLELHANVRKQKAQSEMKLTGGETQQQSNSASASSPSQSEIPRSEDLPSQTTTSTASQTASEPGKARLHTASRPPLHSAKPKLTRSNSSTTSIHSILGTHTKHGVAPVVDPQTVVTAHNHAESFDPDSSMQSAISAQDGPVHGLYSQNSASTSGVTLDKMNKPTLARVNTMSQLHQLQTQSTRCLNNISLSEDQVAGAPKQSLSQLHLSQLLSDHLSSTAGFSRRPSFDSVGAGQIAASSGAVGRISASSIAHLLTGARSGEPRAKPVVSKFVQSTTVDLNPSFTRTNSLPGSEMELGCAVSVDVPPSSVFSASYMDRLLHRIDMDAPPTGHDREQHRYLLDFGLSGPPIDSATLDQADLTPRIETSVLLQDTDQARTQAWSLRNAPRHMMLVPDSTTTLGPNMIPFHFIHALTSTMDHALALDHAEVPAMASLLPGVSDQIDDGLDFSSSPSPTLNAPRKSHFIDNHSMRAIAYTAQAVSVQRTHTVTRRFADPFHTALGRVVRMSGYALQLPSSSSSSSSHLDADCSPKSLRPQHGGANSSAASASLSKTANTGSAPNSQTPSLPTSAAAGSLSEHLQHKITSARTARHHGVTPSGVGSGGGV